MDLRACGHLHLVRRDLRITDDLPMSRRRAPAFTTPACEPQISRERRRAGGIYYTPPEIVQLIVERTLSPLLRQRSPLRILDPACGAGEFLVAARSFTLENGCPPSLVGVDTDPHAIAAACRRLAGIESTPPANIVLGDAL